MKATIPKFALPSGLVVDYCDGRFLFFKVRILLPHYRQAFGFHLNSECVALILLQLDLVFAK